MVITLNGDERDVPAGLTVSGLLVHLGLHERLVVVELNRDILRRSRYGEVSVSAGDTIELVQFVGGG
ncbi:MAG: sulfur carrier protein ThiS [Gemmatimonadetes bacterium]|nr:sulfur carrier protein ThiS [Gemmatimonadota bacterium]NIO31584.1 sulfur carrier protein ThiS [Gemmatimonadota bacterium]